jgi:hypothetical protein
MTATPNQPSPSGKSPITNHQSKISNRKSQIANHQSQILANPSTRSGKSKFIFLGRVSHDLVTLKSKAPFEVCGMGKDEHQVSAFRSLAI